MEMTEIEREYHYHETKIIWLIVFFLTGIMAGTFLFNGLNLQEQTKLMIYSDYVADRIKMDNINQISLLKYVLLYRMKEILLLVMMGMTQYKLVLHSGYLFYLGVKNAVLLSIITAAYKRKAILYFAVISLPQMIVYVLLICYTMKLFHLEQTSYRGMKKNGKVIRMAALYFVMCFLEAFVNPLVISVFV
ncbi:MAG: hypothetical protein II919_04940 [Lachnospiraceae bacterium]|nr:hypothetical protein [Lachnospiraceae bacterium]